jgi:isoquinoline 1-oxidoreductase beta subunit
MSVERNSSLTGPLSRRQFITRTAVGVGGALVVGIELSPGVAWADPSVAEITAGGSLGVYVAIAADNSVTLVCPGSEMGQGITTSLPMIIAEELMVDWAQVKVQLSFADTGLNRGSSQTTGGSNSVRGYHDILRDVGATARERLIAAAAEEHSVDRAALRAEDGHVVHTDGRRWSYASLTATAATITIDPSSVAWVEPPYRIIGHSVQRLDIPSKVNGSAVFGTDVRLDGMVFASVKLAPKVGQTVGSVGAAPRGSTIVRLRDATDREIGVAAVHPRSTWDAINAARSVQVGWIDAGYTASIDTSQMRARAESLMATAVVAPTIDEGAPDSVLGAAPDARRFRRTYSVPYLAHATMEPQNATAVVRRDASGAVEAVEVWAPTQTPTSARRDAATAAGLDRSSVDDLAKVSIRTTYLGGGFGRRLANDYVSQAVQVAAALPSGTPVKLTWSREEDFTHDLHRPASLAALDASVDSAGRLEAMTARIVCGHSSTFALEGFAVRDMLYEFPANYRVEHVRDLVEVPLGFWRSVGHSQNTFFLESFLDEIAIGTGQDPIDLRRGLLSTGSDLHVRANAVLDALVAASGWDTPPPAGRARGVALTSGFGETIVGQVAEVSGSSASNLQVHRVTVVVDPGSVVNPDTVRAQMEGSIVEGLGVALFNSMTFSQGAPNHDNFDTYRMIKMAESPVIDTVIIESGAPMGGVGEPGVPPIAPAVANALARLGARLSSLPLTAASGGGGGGDPVSPTPTITSFTPSSGRVGTTVTISGTNFTGVSKVAFGRTNSSRFTVVSATEIRVDVPRRARSGPISVTTAAGTARSGSDFIII